MVVNKAHKKRTNFGIIPYTSRQRKKRTFDMMFLRVYLGGDFLWRRKDKLFTPIPKS
ncbi:hypothetical protein PthBH41_14590 [Parageobacillus thermoglucosidasius]|uniref:Uncharacterized protein n=1 Tax=Geobacillus sp. (strain Y4.1MC1) TaxID=581103 RepID=A0A7U3YIC6_GEOS0|nr:hypothetical protein PthBH41_14590 [Parageobacillus thermoglucosidasius]GAJ42951.1 hypothetical protein GT2_05_01820 [Parageobacillus thermoglucosidasius NBRC 107763]GCD82260.1 hypothetical protein PTHTG4_13220 [Parageobacillus thermoglucosidasius]